MKEEQKDRQTDRQANRKRARGKIQNKNGKERIKMNRERERGHSKEGYRQDRNMG